MGGNLPSDTGSPASTLVNAVATLASDSCMIRAVSRFYSSPCFPPGAGPDYVNAMVEIGTDLGATDLLDRLHEVEASFGRKREKRWGARTVDLDLIAGGDAVLPDVATQRRWMALEPDRRGVVAPEHIVLPHPRIQERAFVLVPMLGIAPAWVHPVLGLSVQQMLAALPPGEIDAVKPL